jgi:multidrug transporter EmrE-like cation transporter
MNHTALVLLVVAIASEVAGTAGLKASEGFGRLGPSGLTVLGYALAFYFLAQSLEYIPLGVAYAIWSGLGTIGSVSWILSRPRAQGLAGLRASFRGTMIRRGGPSEEGSAQRKHRW